MKVSCDSILMLYSNLCLHATKLCFVRKSHMDEVLLSDKVPGLHTVTPLCHIIWMTFCIALLMNLTSMHLVVNWFVHRSFDQIVIWMTYLGLILPTFIGIVSENQASTDFFADRPTHTYSLLYLYCITIGMYLTPSK